MYQFEFESIVSELTIVVHADTYDQAVDNILKIGIPRINNDGVLKLIHVCVLETFETE